MFRLKILKPMNNARPLRTIEKEMLETRTRYNEYLKTTSDKYMAQRGDVKIKDPHTMAGNAYQEIREFINPIAKFAKKNNKEITFEDARVLTKDCEDLSPSIEDKFAKNILISVKDKLTGKTTRTMVDKFEDPEIPFMKKISNAIGKLTSGKKEANIDKELGI